MKWFACSSVLLGMTVLLGACTEELSTPADCPSLCPGTGLLVRDTVLLANVGQDSSFSGYISVSQAPALLVSNGIAAGEARAFGAFPFRFDSVSVNGLVLPLTVDSIAMIATLVARDSTVAGLKVFFHKIDHHVDSTVTVADIDAMLTPATLIDSLIVPDTLRRGALRKVLLPSQFGPLALVEADSGRLGVGFRIAANEPTGIRLGSFQSGSPPGAVVYGHVDVADTALRHQALTFTGDTTNYVIQVTGQPGPDEIAAGGRLATRSILRFSVPKALRDSSSVLRATLELTPVGPVPGLRNDPATLEVRGTLVDLGAKSPALLGAEASGPIQAEVTDVVSIDVRQIVQAWFTPGNTQATTFLFALSPEGGTFGFPRFFSTRSPSPGGAPRLRITYALPSRPGHP